jgi:hypothetical protein
MGKDHWTNFDTPLETQPPKGAAEGDINYGGVAEKANDKFNDPMGVLPSEAKAKNIGPSSKE